MSEKNFNVNLPREELGERFTQFIKPKGMKKGHAIAGALELFMVIPADVREMLIEGRTNEAKKWMHDRQVAYAKGQALKSAGRSRVRASQKGHPRGQEGSTGGKA